MDNQGMQGGNLGDGGGMGERMVKVTGSSSHLLDGDPDQEDPRYSGHALPVLLHQGWRVKLGVPFSGGVYLVLEGRPAPAARVPGVAGGPGAGVSGSGTVG